LESFLEFSADFLDDFFEYFEWVRWLGAEAADEEELLVPPVPLPLPPELPDEDLGYFDCSEGFLDLDDDV